MEKGDRVQLTDPDSGVVFTGTVVYVILPVIGIPATRVGVEWDDDDQVSTEYVTNENLKLI